MLALTITLAFAQSPSSCAASITSTELAARVSEAGARFAGLDVGGFESTSNDVWTLLPCVDEPLGPLAVADLYQVRALTAFLAQDDVGVSAAMRSLRAAVPGYRLSTALAPKGHPLRVAFDAVTEPDEAPTEDLPVPAEARLLVDGQPVLRRPSDRAVLVQRLTDEGTVTFTSLLEAGEPVPEYPSLDESYREDYLSETRVIRVRQRRPIELIVASGLAVAGAGTMYGLSRSSRATFLDPTTPTDDLAGLRARTNGLQTASIVTGLAGTGLGVLAAVSW